MSAAYPEKIRSWQIKYNNGLTDLWELYRHWLRRVISTAGVLNPASYAGQIYDAFGHMIHDFSYTDVPYRSLVRHSDALAIRYKLVEGGTAPVRGTDQSAGMDLFVRCAERALIEAGRLEHVVLRLGVCVELPPRHVGVLALRSSAARSGWYVPNGIGVIDADYRGELAIVLGGMGLASCLEPGYRIAQLVVLPCVIAPFVQVDVLFETRRGSGGWGSTGTGPLPDKTPMPPQEAFQARPDGGKP